MRIYRLLFGFILSLAFPFTVNASDFVCESGYFGSSGYADGNPELVHRCISEVPKSEYFYDPFTLIDSNGVPFVVTTPGATGYIAPPPSAPSTVADLVAWVDFSDDGLAVLAVFALIVAILTIGRAVRFLLSVLRRA